MQTLEVTPGSDLEKMIFFEQTSGTLFVSKNHAFQANVRSYMQLLRGRGIEHETVMVEMDVINQKQQLNADARTENVERSEMQREATDIFRSAVKSRASDIHIRVSKRGRAEVLFRIHNNLVKQKEEPASWGRLLCSAIYTAMSDVSDATYEEHSRQDARIAARDKIPKELDGIRIATAPQIEGAIMVLRLLYNDTVNSTDLCLLGFAQEQADSIGLMKRRPTGMNIIAGPTGSGKSTTLQRTLMGIHQDCGGAKHIITVEDPPEYPMPGIVQTPVTNAASEEERAAAFQEAIKSAMRLDPNVIMIGEMRDPPSARLGVQAAMTGHQVWTTVHANDAFSVIDRMVDMGISLNVMTDPSIITGIICQRLVKVLCPACKTPMARVLSRYTEKDQERVMASVDVSHVYVKGDGCSECGGAGVAGRSVVAEVVVPTLPLMKFIRGGEKEEAIAYWKARGGRTMLEMAIEKINEGLVDPFQAEEEVGPLNEVIQTGAIA